MSVFIRRFTFDPGTTVLLEIESVNILDLDPPAQITGIGTGTVLVVGEFENGAFNTPQEVFGVDDFSKTYGQLGYTRGGVVGNDPCARSRLADGALTPEYWNGNGFVQLNAKKFARMIVSRVDTSVGSVQFLRQAYITGAASFRYTLAAAQAITLVINGGAPTVATFNATAATVTGAAGTFPTLFTGGETLTLGYDDKPNFTVTFLAADQTNAQVVARINAYAGFAFADLNGGQIRFTSLQKGTGAQVRIVSGATATLGLTVANTAGTGNVANVAAVTFAEIKSVIEAAVASSKVEQDSTGALRISSTLLPGTAPNSVSVSAVTATALGFTVGQASALVTTGGTKGVIPAGTVVQNAAATRVFVTMQDVNVTATNPGPYTVKVRHALDDGTGLSATAGTIVSVPNAPDLGSFDCVNPQIMTAALTEAQIDAAYVAAYAATTDLNSIAREANISFCARQSNVCRRTVRQNAIDASARGCFGRTGLVRPPLNTSPSVARSTVAEPGCGAYRSDRVVYVYIGANTFVPFIARRGSAGGAGFTDNGNVDVGSDGFLASIMSQLPPEENPGQETPFTGGINGIETGANVQGLDITAYTAFKAAGICALRMDGGTAIFQSGVINVDPQVYPQLTRISRRRMADFINDSLALRSKGYGKKLGTFARRQALMNEYRSFLRGLLSPSNPGAQRIGGFDVNAKTSTPDERAQGLFRIRTTVRTLASMDSIVIESIVGENVTEVTEVLPEAA